MLLVETVDLRLKKLIKYNTKKKKALSFPFGIIYIFIHFIKNYFFVYKIKNMMFGSFVKLCVCDIVNDIFFKEKDELY